jgi:hypothetical protein
LHEVTTEIKGQQKAMDNMKKLSPFLGTWTVAYDWRAGWHGNGNGSRGKEEFVLADPYIYGYEINNTGKKCSEPDLRGKILNSGELNWECYLPGTNSGELFYNRWIGGGVADWLPFQLGIGLGNADDLWYPSGWQAVVSCTVANTGIVTIVIPSQHRDPQSNIPKERPVTLVFTKDQQ